MPYHAGGPWCDGATSARAPLPLRQLRCPTQARQDLWETRLHCADPLARILPVSIQLRTSTATTLAEYPAIFLRFCQSHPKGSLFATQYSFANKTKLVPRQAVTGSPIGNKSHAKHDLAEGNFPQCGIVVRFVLPQAALMYSSLLILHDAYLCTPKISTFLRPFATLLAITLLCPLTFARHSGLVGSALPHINTVGFYADAQQAFIKEGCICGQIISRRSPLYLIGEGLLAPVTRRNVATALPCPAATAIRGPPIHLYYQRD